MLNNNWFQAKHLDEIIPSICADRGTVCGSKVNFGTSMKEKRTQVRERIIEFQPKIIMNILSFIMFFWPCIMNWLYINYQLLCTDYYLFIKFNLLIMFRGLSAHLQAVFLQATRNSHTGWQYHMQHAYNCVLLKMSNWISKYEQWTNVLWINVNQCTKVGY